MEETGEEKGGVREVEKKREEAEEGKGEVEVKGVKRPPRAQRKFWGGEGRRDSKGERKGRGREERKRKAAAPRRAKGNRI